MWKCSIETYYRDPPTLANIKHFSQHTAVTEIFFLAKFDTHFNGDWQWWADKLVVIDYYYFDESNGQVDHCHLIISFFFSFSLFFFPYVQIPLKTDLLLNLNIANSIKENKSCSTEHNNDIDKSVFCWNLICLNPKRLKHWRKRAEFNPEGKME